MSILLCIPSYIGTRSLVSPISLFFTTPIPYPLLPLPISCYPSSTCYTRALSKDVAFKGTSKALNQHRYTILRIASYYRAFLDVVSH